MAYFFHSSGIDDRNQNNNNKNKHNDVYGAIVTTRVIARVHPVHLMNVD